MAIGETVTLRRGCTAREIPRGTPLELPAGSPVWIRQAGDGWFTVMDDTGRMLRVAADEGDALGIDPTEADATAVSVPTEGTLEERCWKMLRTVYDPEVPVNLVELGLIYDIVVTPLQSGAYEVVVEFTLTNPGCGMGQVLQEEIERKVAMLPEVSEVQTELVFDPPWDMSRISDAARLQLGLL